MTLKLNGTNSEAAPAYAGDDADTGLQCGTNELKLVTGGTARATVDSSGNLGIGTSSPVKQLQVGAHGSSSEGTIALASTTSGTCSILMGDGATGSDFYRGYVQYSNTNDAMLFATSASERMRILSSGGLTFNGDTAQANALDDYEEGTFTGSFNNQDNDATVSHGNQTGFYVKVGSLVHFSLYFDDIDVSSVGSISNAHIFGLPFTSLGTSQHYSVVNIIHNTILTSAAGGYVNTNSTNIIPVDVGTTTTSTFSTGTNKRLMVGGTYRAA